MIFKRVSKSAAASSLLALGLAAGLSFANGLEGPYAPDRWSGTVTNSGFGAGNVAAAAPAIEFEYDLDDSFGGLQESFVTFKTTATENATITFNYEWRGLHAFFLAEAGLRVFADGPNGGAEVVLVPFETDVSGTFTSRGRATIEVKQGFDFGFEIQARNFDSNAIARGSLVIYGFSAGLEGDYAIENWSSSIVVPVSPEQVTAVLGASPAVEVSYDGSIRTFGGSSPFTCGSSQQGTPEEVDLTTFAFGDNTATLRWALSYDHSFFDEYAEIQAITERNGQITAFPLETRCNTGAGTKLTGGAATIPTSNFERFGIRVVASNFASNSGFRGTLVIWDFDGPSDDACLVDITTNNTNPGDPGFGEPDGLVNGADLSLFVELWLSGCNFGP